MLLVNPAAGFGYVTPQSLVAYPDVKVFSNDGHYCAISKFVLAAMSELGKRLLPALDEDINGISVDLSKEQLEMALQLMVCGTLPLGSEESIMDVLNYLEVDIHFHDLERVKQELSPSSDHDVLPEFCQVGQTWTTRGRGDTDEDVDIIVEAAEMEPLAVESDDGDAPSSKSLTFQATLEPVDNFDSWDEDEEDSDGSEDPDISIHADFDGMHNEENEVELKKHEIKLEIEHPKIIPLVMNRDSLLCRQFGIQDSAKVVLTRLDIGRKNTESTKIQEMHFDESDPPMFEDGHFDIETYSGDLSDEGSHFSPRLDGSDSFGTEDERSGCEEAMDHQSYEYQHQAVEIVEYSVMENDLVCHVCSKVCTSKLMLKRHLECHDSSSITCSFENCDFVTHTRAILSSHLSKTHDLKGPKFMVCPLCSQSFSSKTVIGLHLKDEHSQVYPFYCNLCKSKPFFFAWEFSNHHQENHMEMTCKVCCENVSNKVELHKHLRDKHPGTEFSSDWDMDIKFNCPYCEETKDCSMTILTEHLNVSHQMKAPYSCQKCRYVSSTLGPLLYHHGKNHTPTVCHVCGVEVKNNHAMRQHLKSHQKTHRCNVTGCSYSTNIYSLALSHSANAHGNVEKRKTGGKQRVARSKQEAASVSLSCNSCGQIFESENKLNHHRFTDHEEGYRCPEKGCVFVTHLKNALVMHRNHIYKQEEKSFQTKRLFKGNSYSPIASELRGHLIHGEFYRCPYCNFQSSEKTIGLLRHIESEHGFTSPFPCIECKKTFLRTRHLSQHIRRHHTRVECPICKKVVPGMEMKDHLFNHEKKGKLLKKHESKGKLSLPNLKPNCKDQSVNKLENNQCPFCDFKCLESSKELWGHYKNAHEPKLKCLCKDCVDICEEVPDILNHHVLNYPVACKLCKAETNLADIRDHMEQVHSIKSPCEVETKVSCFSPGCSFFDYQMVLDYHQEIAHTSFESLYCGGCQIFTHTKKTFLAHHKEVHDEENILKCSLCEAEFDAPLLLSRHMDEKPSCKLMPQAVFGCQIPNCEFSFTELSLLTKHLIVDHDDEVSSPSCPVKNCFYRPAKTLQELLHHCNTTHSRLLQYVCILCGQSFPAEEFTQHSSNIHCKSLVFSCFICDRFYATEEQLMEHQKTSHTSNHIYLCRYGYCRKKFTSSSEIKNHMKTHYPIQESVPNISNCGVCGMQFSDNKSRKSHTLRKHCFVSMSSSQKRKRDIICQYCNESFGSFMAARNHKLKIHRDEANYHCQDCGAAFFSSQALKKHQIMLIECKRKSVYNNMNLLRSAAVCGKKTFDCASCLAAFKSEEELMVHKMSEGNAKCSQSLISCTECTSKFIKGDALINHMKSEHPEKLGLQATNPKKNVQCSRCKGFFYSDRHISAHGCFERNECRFCGKKFTNFRSMSKHRRKEHSKEATHKCSDCKEIFFCQFGLECHLRIKKCGNSVKSVLKKNQDQSKSDECQKKCPLCGEIFVERQSLLKHLEDSHEPEEALEASILELECTDEEEETEEQQDNSNQGDGQRNPDVPPSQEIQVIKVEPSLSSNATIQLLPSQDAAEPQHDKRSNASPMVPKPINLSQYPPSIYTQNSQEQPYAQNHHLHQHHTQQLHHQVHYPPLNDADQQFQQHHPNLFFPHTSAPLVQTLPVNDNNGGNPVELNYMSLDALLQGNSYHPHIQ